MTAENDSRTSAEDPADTEHTSPERSTASESPNETPEQHLGRIADEHGVSTDGDTAEAKRVAGADQERESDVRGGDGKDDGEDPEPPD